MRRGRPKKNARTAVASAAHRTPVGSAAAAAAADREGGLDEMDVDAALALADAAQHGLEAAAADVDAMLPELHDLGARASG